MSSTTNTQTQTEEKAKAWLKPEQVDELRTTTVAESANYLSLRNDTIIAMLYDSGLRVGELVQLDVDMLDLDEGIIMLPPDIQKDYPNDNTPSYTEIELATDTVRTLRNYLNSRWKNPDALFPSRQSERMTTESVRNVVEDAAVEGNVHPQTLRGRGEPKEITPHTLRHSVAYRMLNREDGNTLYDVTKRLRHATIQTTERVYSHFDRV
ncbi:tyrosine-type recombinase/integrase [Natribaculum luteum]|uniref:Tyrosine-type recombinase/integrase n=1 Tax=Natribaculum luteum TaxID=1586232 RepID=A0ABD5P5V7_9EURY|nr:tyrosine-type recombinase/integrase [Natribaculum luteum]